MMKSTLKYYVVKIANKQKYNGPISTKGTVGLCA